jgi:hypothetical protein
LFFLPIDNENQSTLKEGTLDFSKGPPFDWSFKNIEIPPTATPMIQVGLPAIMTKISLSLLVSHHPKASSASTKNQTEIGGLCHTPHTFQFPLVTIFSTQKCPIRPEYGYANFVRIV